jgi:hypothetical protein
MMSAAYTLTNYFQILHSLCANAIVRTNQRWVLSAILSIANTTRNELATFLPRRFHNFYTSISSNEYANAAGIWRASMIGFENRHPRHWLCQHVRHCITHWQSGKEMEVQLQQRLIAMTSRSSGKVQSGSTTSIEIMTAVSMAFTIHAIALTFCRGLHRSHEYLAWSPISFKIESSLVHTGGSQQQYSTWEWCK